MRVPDRPVFHRASLRPGHERGRQEAKAPVCEISLAEGVETVTRRLGRILLGLGIILLAVGLAGGLGLWWRLASGPISLAFLKDRAEGVINDTIAASGFVLKTDDIILELDEESRIPLVRLSGVRFVDGEGRVLVHAPRGVVGLDGRAILRGEMRVRRIELIGPRITVRRRKDGELEVGFRPTSRPDRQLPAGAAPARRRGGGAAGRASVSTAKEDMRGESLAGKLEELALADVFRFIDEQIFSVRPGAEALASLEVIHIARASISYYDAINDILLYAPRADLVFQRVPFGHVLYAKAGISSGGRPWRVELTATFRRKARTYTVAARVHDVVVADVARNVFALTQLAQMKLPLSGHVEANFTHDGQLLKASAELSVGQGEVNFPGYIARPVRIREGLIRLDYLPRTGVFVLHPSLVFINGGATEISGRFRPRIVDGRLAAVDVQLELGRGDVKAPARKGELVIDHLKMDGEMRLDAAAFVVRDMILAAGGGVIRMRGRFVGEKEGVGIYVAGRGRDIPARVVKKLWPPVLAPGARQWLREHLIRGRIPEGTFQLALPAKAIMAAIERDEPVPDSMVHVAFSVADVSFTYVRGLPPVQETAGQALMTGNHFTLELNRGYSLLPSGRRLQLERGLMQVRDLARKVSPAVIELRVAGDVTGLAELLDMEPLQLLRKAGFARERMGGQAVVDMTFRLPLSREVTAGEIRVSASATVKKAKLVGLPGGFDLTDGDLNLLLRDGRLTVAGRARLNDLPARLKWSRAFDRPESAIELSMTLDDAARRKLGFDLAPWLTGTMPMRITAQERGGRVDAADVRIDLSRVRMRIDAIGWHRSPVKGTRGRLKLDFGKKGLIRIPSLRITGPGLNVRGRMVLKEGGGLIEATFPRFELDSANRLALGLVMRNGVLEVAAAGQSFDARPLIARLLGGGDSNGGGGGPGHSGPAAGRTPPVRVKVNIGGVLAARGEQVFNVKGLVEQRQGLVTRLSLTGLLSSRRPVSIDLAPAAGSLRRLRIVADDAGAVLRAAGLYSRIFGGRMEFSALLRRDGTVQRGLLVIRRFEVRNEGRLAEIARRDRRRRGPRRGMRFRKLVLPFSTDARFVRIGNALVKGDELGATANGIIRKQDLAMDIGGTIIPVYALNAAIGKVPIIGQLLTGGGGQGVFALTFALKGTMRNPKFIVNPASALAPGILRQFFQMGGHKVNPDGTPRTPPRPARGPTKLQNIR